MNTITLNVSAELITRSCPACAGVYAITKEYFGEALRVGHFRQCWTCPYCKTERGFGESETDRLRKQLEETQRNLSAEKCSTINERNARELVEKKLRRVKNGVCPCCNRSFVNLQRHIKTKHPQFTKKK